MGKTHEIEYDLFGEVPEQVKHSIGYAGMPGAGPAGETCGTCEHIERGKYRKCGHPRGYKSSSEASDILARSPACEYWEGSR